jgi:hypothetical protein
VKPQNIKIMKAQSRFYDILSYLRKKQKFSKNLHPGKEASHTHVERNEAHENYAP